MNSTCCLSKAALWEHHWLTLKDVRCYPQSFVPVLRRLSVSSRSPHLITNLQSYIKLCFIFCLAFLLNNVFCCLLSRLWHTCLRKVHHKYTCLDSTWKTNCSNKESRADVCRPLTVNRSCGCPLPWKLCPHYKILGRHNPKGGRKGRATKAK